MLRMGKALRLVAVVLVACIVSTLAPGMAAARGNGDLDQQLHVLAVKAASRMQRQADGTVVVQGTAATFGVSAEAFNRFMYGLEAVNYGVRHGTLSVDGAGHVRAVGKDGAASHVVSPQFWGCVETGSLVMSEAKTLQFEAFLGWVADGLVAVTVLAAAIGLFFPPTAPVAGAATLAAGLLAVGVSAFSHWMQYVDEGRGDTLHYGRCDWGWVTVAYARPTGN